MHTTKISDTTVKIITPQEDENYYPFSGCSILHPEEGYSLFFTVKDYKDNNESCLLIKDIGLDEIEYLGRFLINSAENIRKEKL